MGSYLNIYAKSKKTEEMTSILALRTSSSEIYQYIREVCDIASVEEYNDETHQLQVSNKYTKLTSEILSEAMQTLGEYINKSRHHLEICYKISGKVELEEAVMEIAREEEYLEELKLLEAQFKFLDRIVQQADNNWLGIEGLYMQVG